MSVRMKTTVYKWENGRIVEVDARDKSNVNLVSEEKRRQDYERNRNESINEKKKK